MHHQWARQEFSPVRLSACKASILLRKTARAVVRRARRTLFAPRFRSRSIVAPAHKPAAIFSDQSPRDEHERLREVRVRPEGNGAPKNALHESVGRFFIALFQEGTIWCTVRDTRTGRRHAVP